MNKFILIGSLIFHAVACIDPEPPKNHDCYIVHGILYLPYAEITESFTGFYDSVNNRSRIDYYDNVQTYQIGSKSVGDNGVSYKVAPMTTEEVLNEIHCFQVNGTQMAPILPQSSIPDVSDYQYSGNKLVNEKNCSIWEKTTIVGGKKNTYFFYQNIKNERPIRFEMLGYDSLFGSHYDHYYIDYKQFKKCDKLSDKFFKPDITCTGFPGPGHEHITMNPMKEYVHADDGHVHEAFNHFINKHDKKYNSTMELERRKITFRQNLRYIHSRNRAGLTYSLAVNHLADHTTDEMTYLRGRKRTNEYNGGIPFDPTNFTYKNIPDYFDWRYSGAVTPVKDQAVCGSCWSFGTVGCVEGAYFLKNKELVSFSEQELIDCSWGEGNNACDGGEDFRAYQWIMKHGLATEYDYGKYIGQDGLCKMNAVKPTFGMKGYVNVTSGDANAFKLSMLNYGPVSVAIDASHKSLSFYSGGIYFEPECGNKLENLDHAVLAVGFGELNSEAFWLIKNSWSTYWGNDGYVLMAQKDNNCGVLTTPTNVLM